MISGVLLAAGRSQRMGQPKLLLPWHGIPLVQHMAQIALQSQLDELVVVVGYRAEHVRAALKGLMVHIVHNVDFLEGQSTSLRAGMDAIDDAAQAVVILLADQPLLQSATIDRLITTYSSQSTPIVAPRYNGRRGNPVLFSNDLFTELRGITGDQGARSLLDAHEQQVSWIDVDDEGVALDIDTPDMYQRLIGRSG